MCVCVCECECVCVCEHGQYMYVYDKNFITILVDKGDTGNDSGRGKHTHSTV